MDKFPDTINARSYKDQLVANELALLKATREQFTNIIENNIKNICYVSELVFDNRLCPKYKKIIITELLEKFGVLGIVHQNGVGEISTTIYINSVIPDNVKSITIKIDKD